MIKRNGDNVFAIASNSPCALRSSVSLCPGGGAATRIPRATAARMTPPDAHHTKEANIVASTYVEKWKNRYEEAERKHKSSLLKSEKAKREHDDLQRRFNLVSDERTRLAGSLAERERDLLALRDVSEKLFKEYQQLQNQREVDDQLMQKVMQQAGEWYKQNKQLKRRSAAILHALPAHAEVDFTDSNSTASDSSNEEVEFLKQTVSDLSKQVASLQAELSAARLQEFEAHESTASLAQELDAEKERAAAQAKELEELKGQIERHHRVSKLLMEEVSALKDHADKDREMAETYKSQARDAKKRVKVLTHQSTLLLGELELDERLHMLLGEVDSLKDALELQANRHRDQIEELQLKLAEKHEDTDILLWEEKIKLAEEDARNAIERAELAERKLTEERKLAEERRLEERRLADEKRSPQKRGTLMSRISYFESGTEKKDEKREEAPVSAPSVLPPLPPPPPAPPSAPAAPPAPVFSPPPPPTLPPPPPPPPPPMAPPPPPPPPPPAVFSPTEGSDMANMLANKQGTLRKTKQNGGGPAIDSIVDQIKGGNFTLRRRDQSFLEKKPKEEQPEAVKEMLSILGTLRKRRSVHRPSLVGLGDQA